MMATNEMVMVALGSTVIGTITGSLTIIEIMIIAESMMIEMIEV